MFNNLEMKEFLFDVKAATAHRLQYSDVPLQKMVPVLKGSMCIYFQGDKMVLFKKQLGVFYFVPLHTCK